jgi:serine/threonine protein phosphatase PrpC
VQKRLSFVRGGMVEQQPGPRTEWITARGRGVRHAGRTDVGVVRGHNEDFLLVVDDDPADLLFIVADGMGGHAAGEVASKLAADTLATFFRKSRGGDVTWPFKIEPELPLVENRLVCGVKLASYHIFLEARADAGRKGMGTTIVAAAIDPAGIHIAHVGDSRAYRVRGGSIEQLTPDHTFLEEFKRLSPGMTPEEERAFPHRGVLSRALGVREAVEVEVQRHALAPGDRFLLCSDGLSGQVDSETMAAIVADAEDLDQAAAGLIALANQAGGPDNSTALLIACEG